jgi:hypothetical protein
MSNNNVVREAGEKLAGESLKIVPPLAHLV